MRYLKVNFDFPLRGLALPPPKSAIPVNIQTTSILRYSLIVCQFCSEKEQLVWKGQVICNVTDTFQHAATWGKSSHT